MVRSDWPEPDTFSAIDEKVPREGSYAHQLLLDEAAEFVETTTAELIATDGDKEKAAAAIVEKAQARAKTEIAALEDQRKLENSKAYATAYLAATMQVDRRLRGRTPPKHKDGKKDAQPAPTPGSVTPSAADEDAAAPSTRKSVAQTRASVAASRHSVAAHASAAAAKLSAESGETQADIKAALAELARLQGDHEQLKEQRDQMQLDLDASKRVRRRMEQEVSQNREQQTELYKKNLALNLDLQRANLISMMESTVKPAHVAEVEHMHKKLYAAHMESGMLRTHLDIMRDSNRKAMEVIQGADTSPEVQYFIRRAETADEELQEMSQQFQQAHAAFDTAQSAASKVRCLLDDAVDLSQDTLALLQELGEGKPKASQKRQRRASEPPMANYDTRCRAEPSFASRKTNRKEVICEPMYVMLERGEASDEDAVVLQRARTEPSRRMLRTPTGQRASAASRLSLTQRPTLLLSPSGNLSSIMDLDDIEDVRDFEPFYIDYTGGSDSELHSGGLSAKKRKQCTQLGQRPRNIRIADKVVLRIDLQNCSYAALHKRSDLEKSLKTQLSTGLLHLARTVHKEDLEIVLSPSEGHYAHITARCTFRPEKGIDLVAVQLSLADAEAVRKEIEQRMAPIVKQVVAKPDMGARVIGQGAVLEADGVEKKGQQSSLAAAQKGALEKRCWKIQVAAERAQRFWSPPAPVKASASDAKKRASVAPSLALERVAPTSRTENEDVSRLERENAELKQLLVEARSAQQEAQNAEAERLDLLQKCQSLQQANHELMQKVHESQGSYSVESLFRERHGRPMLEQAAPMPMPAAEGSLSEQLRMRQALKKAQESSVTMKRNASKKAAAMQYEIGVLREQLSLARKQVKEDRSARKAEGKQQHAPVVGYKPAAHEQAIVRLHNPGAMGGDVRDPVEQARWTEFSQNFHTKLGLPERTEDSSQHDAKVSPSDLLKKLTTMHEDLHTRFLKAGGGQSGD
eukprot:TRINITY_DN40818_c0_g2_i1.p1 TRINITY_DN40818_c0_g2~~TRINITY_DN40818_c0_g2_i1.p1  ORF type:complete len:976 (+),score=277.12 TRINITY_DN40818_c0_g2_i1:208-3135(+)